MSSEIKDIVEGILVVASALFPIVNPIGSAPIFLAMTSDLSVVARRRLSIQVTINCFVLMLASVYVGGYVLNFFTCRCTWCRQLSAFIVLCLGVQISWNGISALVTQLVATLR